MSIQSAAALAMTRAALKAAPLALAALMTHLPANAQNAEWTGRSIGNDLARAAAGPNSNPYAANIGATILSAWGASAGKQMDERSRQQAEENAIKAQARRDVIYEAERRKVAAEMGIPYSELAQRSANSPGMAYGGGSSFDRLIAAQNNLTHRPSSR